jgi:tRNA isopentenyl-2-thiomethyl-A-37 hydroxylase MiaE
VLNDKQRRAIFARHWNKMPDVSRFRILDKAGVWGYKESNSNQRFSNLTPHVQELLLNFSKNNHDSNMNLRIPKKYVKGKNGIMIPVY